MKFLFDFFPVVAFFITFKIPEDPHQGILLATAVAIATSVVQVALFWIKHHRFQSMHLITLAAIVVLGGATLLLQDERFIKWKPTAVNWLFALSFLASEFIGKKNLVRRIMESNVSLPDPVWFRLNLSWVIFFGAVGIINLYVAFNFKTEDWVNFKLFGIIGLTLLFIIAQAIYLVRYVRHPEDIEEH